MSEKVDKFCSDLRDRLTAIEDRLNQAKESVEKASHDTHEAIEAKKAEIKTKADADKQKVKDAEAKAKNWVEAKVAAAEADIEEWKTKREIHKLEKRADHAEDYAASAIILAAAAVDEAEFAILDAVGARLLAEDAASA